MTTFDFTTEECLVCATPTEVAILASSTTFGPPDLDTRPAPMLRDALSFEITQCATCGFCWEPGTDEEVDAELARRSVESDAYRSALCSRLLDPAPAFLARSVLDASMSRYAEAGWNAVRASWVCDDAGEEEAAEDARADALKFWSAALAIGQDIYGQEGGDAILRAELMRRNGDFEAATELIDARLPGIEDENIAIVLSYCRELCAAHDSFVHTVGEAFDAVEA